MQTSLCTRGFSRSKLQAFWVNHPDAESSLRAWFHEVEAAPWSGPAEVRARYGSADFIGNDRIIFNIRGNRYRLVACVRYAPLHLVYVRFIGTHAEYDAIDVKTI
jgi:mRNA interferase HigB